MRIFIFKEPRDGSGAFDKYNCLDEKDFLKRARSLLVVVASPPANSQYENFSKEVLEYTSREPFKFQTPPVFKNVSYTKASSHLIIWNPFFYAVNFCVIYY